MIWQEMQENGQRKLITILFVAHLGVVFFHILILILVGDKLVIQILILIIILFVP